MIGTKDEGSRVPEDVAEKLAKSNPPEATLQSTDAVKPVATVAQPKSSIPEIARPEIDQQEDAKKPEKIAWRPWHAIKFEEDDASQYIFHNFVTKTVDIFPKFLKATFQSLVGQELDAVDVEFINKNGLESNRTTTGALELFNNLMAAMSLRALNGKPTADTLEARYDNLMKMGVATVGALTAAYIHFGSVIGTGVKALYENDSEGATKN